MNIAPKSARQVAVGVGVDYDEPVGINAAQVVDCLVDATAQISGALDRILAGRQLQRGEFEVLAALHHSGQISALNPSALAAMTASSRAGMTGRLDRLEVAGLIRRISDRGDRRSIKVVLTSAGADLAERALADYAAGAEKVLGAVSADGSRQLYTLLRMLCEGLESAG